MKGSAVGVSVGVGVAPAPESLGLLVRTPPCGPDDVVLQELAAVSRKIAIPAASTPRMILGLDKCLYLLPEAAICSPRDKAVRGIR
jgi:hypothetical protein